MRFALFSPYGLLHREAGLMYLVTNYLAKQGAEVVQLRCDGALPACGRDRRGGGVRSPFQCARCLNEQRSLSAWAGAQSRDISTFLVPEDIKKTLEWIAAVPANALERVEFRGVNLWSVCVNELRLRWDEVDISNLSDAQEGDLRNLYVAYVRVAVASERLIGQWKPDLTVLSSIHDPIAHAYLLQAKLAGIDAAVCSYQAEEELVVFESLASKESYATPLALEGITGMRSDPRTWGPEVTAVVHEVLTYLGYPPDRLV